MNYVKCLYQSLFYGKDIKISHISVYRLLYFVIICCITFYHFISLLTTQSLSFILARRWSLKDHIDVRKAGIQIQVLLLNYCVTLGNVFNLFKPQVRAIAMRKLANLIHKNSMKQAQHRAGNITCPQSMLTVILILTFIIATVTVFSP